MCQSQKITFYTTWALPLAEHFLVYSWKLQQDKNIQINTFIMKLSMFMKLYKKWPHVTGVTWASYTTDIQILIQ